MRDPDLVYRAERAAIALERAWSGWRVMHGAGTGPLPQITSYVGYSLTEPWGEPRVVLGVPADEAERLAALLEGHDCFGPVHAEVASRPDWRRGTSGGPADTGGPAEADGRSYDGPLDVPAQPRGPEADQLSASWQDLPREPDSGAWDNAARVRAARDSVTRERAARDSVTRERAARERTDDRGGDSGLLSGRSVLPDDSADLTEGTPPGANRPQVPWDFPAVPLLPAPENGQRESTSPPGPDPALAQGGPGYRGPRYLGSPPRYQPELDDDFADTDDATGFGGSDWGSGVEQQVGTGSRLGDDGDAAEVAQVRFRTGAPDDAAPDEADIAADDDDPSWADLGPAVSGVGSAVEAELTAEPGQGAAAGLSEAGLAAEADPAAAGNPMADTGRAAAGDERTARKADQAVGKDGKPARAGARKAVRRTRSAASKPDEPEWAGAVTEDELSPNVSPQQDRDDSTAVAEAEQYPRADDEAAMTEGVGDDSFGDGDAADRHAADRWTDDHEADLDEPGAPPSGKPARSRSRPVARLARSRRGTPGAHEGSGWPATGRTAKNSKV